MCPLIQRYLSFFDSIGPEPAVWTHSGSKGCARMEHLGNKPFSFIFFLQHSSEIGWHFRKDLSFCWNLYQLRFNWPSHLWVLKNRYSISQYQGCSSSWLLESYLYFLKFIHCRINLSLFFILPSSMPTLRVRYCSLLGFVWLNFSHWILEIYILNLLGLNKGGFSRQEYLVFTRIALETSS